MRILAALVLAVLLAVAAAAGWLAGTQGGLEWALAQAQRLSGGKLEAEGARGALAGRVTLARAAWGDEGTRIALEGVSGQLSLLNLLTGTVRIDGLSVQRARVSLAPGEKDASSPQSIALPLSVRLAGADVAELVLERAGNEPLRFSALHFNYSGSSEGHRLHNASAVTPWGRVALDATMTGAPPFALDAQGTLERPEARVRAHAVLHPFAEPLVQALEAGVAALDLAALDPRLPHTRLDVRFDGAGAPGALLRGTLSAINRDPGALDEERLPLKTLDAKLALQGERVVLEALQAQAAGGTVSGSGSARPGEAQLTLQLSRVDLQAVRSTLRATSLAGNLELALSPERQAVRGTLAQQDMKLFADAVRRGERIEVKALRAQAAGGVVTGSGEIRLGEPASAKGELRFSGFDPSRFGAYPAGSLTGTASVSGTLGTPRRLSARWQLARSTLAGKRLASAGRASLDGERLHGVEATATWGANRLHATGALGGARDSLAWKLDAPELPVEAISGRVRAEGTLHGSVREPRIAFSGEMAPFEVSGRFRAARLAAQGSGTLAEHRLLVSMTGKDFDVQASFEGGRHGEAGWTGRLLELTNRGRYPLALDGAVPLALSARAVSIGALRAKLGEGRIAIERADWTPGRLSSAGAFTGLPAAWLVAAAGAGERLRSTLLLDGQWAISSSPALDGSLAVRRASGDLALTEPVPLELGLSQAVLEAKADAGRITARLSAQARLGAIDARASASGIEPASTLQAEADLRIGDLRVLAARLPPAVRVAGSADATLSARGTLGAPELAGSLRAQDLSVHLPPYGVYLEDGTLRAQLAGETLRVEELVLRGGEGRLVASGALPLTPQATGARVEWRAQRLQLAGRPDLRLVVSGSGEAGVDAGRVAVQGKVAFDSGYVERGFEGLPELGDDVVVAGRPADQPAARGRVPLDLAVHVDLGSDFRVREAGFDGLLRGEVHVSTTAEGEPRAFGTIRAADATYRAYGRTLAVDPGEVTFNGPVRNPSLQIEAWRRNQEVAAGVRITGNLQQPRVELISDPPVPEGAKLSWLVLGRAPSDASGADLSLLQAAAGAMLGRGDSVPITTRIADRLGLDEIGVRGSSQIESRVVAVGKRLSERLYLTYEQGIGAAAQNLVKIDLSLTDRISLRAQTGTTSGAGVYYRYSWD
jgi:translocation and assembly module TamB